MKEHDKKTWLLDKTNEMVVMDRLPWKSALNVAVALLLHRIVHNKNPDRDTQ